MVVGGFRSFHVLVTTGISRLKLHGEFPTEHDFGAEKYQILICSPESFYEESVREQLLKLQKKYRTHGC